VLAEAARLHGGGSSGRAGSSDGASGSASRLSDLQSGEAAAAESWASGPAEGSPLPGWPARARGSASAAPAFENDTVKLSAAVAEAAAGHRQPTGKPAPDASERWRAANTDEFAERRREKRQLAPAAVQDSGQ
jgi:hypothetical protein